MERVKNIEKSLEKEMKVCSNIIHDMEDKLEHAYLDENVVEMKRCENALETLDIEYFQLKAKLAEMKKGDKKVMKTANKHEKEIERDLKYCEEVMHDIEHKLETAYVEEDLIAIRRCEAALNTLDEEFFELRKEMEEYKH